jgi:hypothetical protein
MALKGHPKGPPIEYLQERYRTVLVRLDLEHGRKFDDLLKQWQCTAAEALRRLIDAQFEPRRK